MTGKAFKNFRPRGPDARVKLLKLNRVDEKIRLSQVIFTMRQFTFMGFHSTNELGIVRHRTYNTKYHGLTSIKFQPEGGNLLAAANEYGSIVLYDIVAETNLPQQFKILGFEFGGISELFWVSADIVVAGTTRGHLVVFNLKNEARRLFEVCSVKAHGDGASMVAVQSIDFCVNTNCLVSVGQGVGSVRLWDVASNGVLTPRALPSPIAFCEPRFVTFLGNGSHVLVGFFERALMQKFSVEPWALEEEHALGQNQGETDQRQLGNAILLPDGRLLILNLKDGFDIYETTKFSIICSGRYAVNTCCSQGVSTLRNGSYVLALSTKGRLNIYRARDDEICFVATLKLPGSGVISQAIHATSFNNRDIIAAASSVDGKESSITIWMDGSHHIKGSKRSSLALGRGEYSTIQIVLLSVLVYTLCQLLTSQLLLPNLAFLSTSLVAPALDLNKGESDQFSLSDVPSVTEDLVFTPKSTIPADRSLSLVVQPVTRSRRVKAQFSGPVN